MYVNISNTALVMAVAAAVRRWLLSPSNIRSCSGGAGDAPSGAALADWIVTLRLGEGRSDKEVDISSAIPSRNPGSIGVGSWLVIVVILAHFSFPFRDILFHTSDPKRRSPFFESSHIILDP